MLSRYLHKYKFLVNMHARLFNTTLCILIVVIGIEFSLSISTNNDDSIPTNIRWIDSDTYCPIHQLQTRRAKSRFWKRVPYRKFGKRSFIKSATHKDNINLSSKKLDNPKKR